jgi:hypothetical protein
MMPSALMHDSHRRPQGAAEIDRGASKAWKGGRRRVIFFLNVALFFSKFRSRIRIV